MILKLTPPLLAFVVALISIVIEEKWPKKTKRHKLAMGALLCIMLAFVVTTCITTYKDEKKSATKSAEIKQKGAQILGLAQTNVALSAKLVTLSEQNVGYISGGRLYCAFYPYYDSVKNRFRLSLQFHGRYKDSPKQFRNVTVYIRRRAYLARQAPIESAFHVRSWQYDKSFMLIDGSYHSTNNKLIADELFFPVIHTDDSFRTICEFDANNLPTSAQFTVEFYAQNGSWAQILQFAKVNKTWAYASTTMPTPSTESFVFPDQQLWGSFPTNMLTKKKSMYPN